MIAGRPKLTLPPRIVSIDVETTGLHSADRVVSFGAVAVDTAGLVRDEVQIEAMHLVFDPWKTSHPDAAALHGWDEWTLRHQEPFATRAETIRSLLEGADLVIAHHAAFDLRFVGGEFLIAGLEPLTTASYCTMEGARASGQFSRTSLDYVCRGLGLRRQTSRHGALEDAWLALCVYLWLHGWRHLWDGVDLTEVSPSNLLPAPPRPEGPLPRRKRKARTAGAAAVPDATEVLAVASDTPPATSKWVEVMRICRATGVPLLRSLWVGLSIGPELDVIAKFAIERCLERGIDLKDDELERLRLYIGRMQPSERSVEQCISALSSSPESFVIVVMRTCMDVVRADGVVRPEEERLLLRYYERITGRKITSPNTLSESKQNP